MGAIHQPKEAKFFIGMLSSDAGLFDEVSVLLADRHGPADLRCGPYPWDHTAYYREEMGDGLLRYFLFFERLMDPGALTSLKRDTNRLEGRFLDMAGSRSGRRINLDPGYLTEAKVVLASTKDYAHRIYLGEGIYAEVTLQFREGSFRPIETTYPDFRTPDVLDLFTKAREMLRASLRRT